MSEYYHFRRDSSPRRERGTSFPKSPTAFPGPLGEGHQEEPLYSPVRKPLFPDIQRDQYLASTPGSHRSAPSKSYEVQHPSGTSTTPMGKTRHRRYESNEPYNAERDDDYFRDPRREYDFVDRDVEPPNDTSFVPLQSQMDQHARRYDRDDEWGHVDRQRSHYERTQDRFVDRDFRPRGESGLARRDTSRRYTGSDRRRRERDEVSTRADYGGDLESYGYRERRPNYLSSTDTYQTPREGEARRVDFEGHGSQRFNYEMEHCSSRGRSHPYNYPRPVPQDSSYRSPSWSRLYPSRRDPDGHAKDLYPIGDYEDALYEQESNPQYHVSEEMEYSDVQPHASNIRGRDQSRLSPRHERDRSRSPYKGSSPYHAPRRPSPRRRETLQPTTPIYSVHEREDKFREWDDSEQAGYKASTLVFEQKSTEPYQDVRSRRAEPNVAYGSDRSHHEAKSTGSKLSVSIPSPSRHQTGRSQGMPNPQSLHAVESNRPKPHVSFTPSTDVSNSADGDDASEFFQSVGDTSTHSNAERVATAQLLKKQSEARHQILRELRQAMDMRDTATSSQDGKFWEQQIESLNKDLGRLCNSHERTPSTGKPREIHLEASPKNSSGKMEYEAASIEQAPGPSNTSSQGRTKLKVRAPEDLPGGHKFNLRINGSTVEATVPSGGVRKGDVFVIRLPFDPTRGNDDRSSTAPEMVKVRAPASLPEGYRFTAKMGEDRTIIATVPQGGVQKGEIFRVPVVDYKGN